MRRAAVREEAGVEERRGVERRGEERPAPRSTRLGLGLGCGRAEGKPR